MNPIGTVLLRKQSGPFNRAAVFLTSVVDVHVAAAILDGAVLLGVARGGGGGDGGLGGGGRLLLAHEVMHHGGRRGSLLLLLLLLLGDLENQMLMF